MSYISPASSPSCQIYHWNVPSKRELLDYLTTVSLGTKSDQSGRSVLYLLLRWTLKIEPSLILLFVLSNVVNGDKIVTNMLDRQIVIIDDEKEETDVEYKKVTLDYNCLFENELEIDNILKDILDLPLKNVSEESWKHF